MAEQPDLRDEEPQTLPSPESDIASVKMRRPYSKLTMDLTQEDLTHPGVQKMMLGEIERLTEEHLRLNEYLNNYYQVDKERAVLQEQAKKFFGLETLYSLGLSCGGVLIGLSASFLLSNVSQTGAQVVSQTFQYGWGTVLAIGVVIMSVSIFARLVKR